MKDEINEVIQSPKSKEKQLNWKVKQKSSHRNALYKKKKKKNVAGSNHKLSFDFQVRIHELGQSDRCEDITCSVTVSTTFDWTILNDSFPCY